MAFHSDSEGDSSPLSNSIEGIRPVHTFVGKTDTDAQEIKLTAAEQASFVLKAFTDACRVSTQDQSPDDSSPSSIGRQLIDGATSLFPQAVASHMTLHPGQWTEKDSGATIRFLEDLEGLNFQRLGTLTRQVDEARKTLDGLRASASNQLKDHYTEMFKLPDLVTRSGN